MAAIARLIGLTLKRFNMSHGDITPDTSKERTCPNCESVNGEVRTSNDKIEGCTSCMSSCHFCNEIWEIDVLYDRLVKSLKGNEVIFKPGKVCSDCDCEEDLQGDIKNITIDIFKTLGDMFNPAHGEIVDKQMGVN